MVAEFITPNSFRIQEKDLDSHIDFIWNNGLCKNICDYLASKLNSSSKSYIISLRGDLGAGKTTWSRNFLHFLGIKGNVKSPTFNYVIEYKIPKDIVDKLNLPFDMVYHFDLYRIENPADLYELGLDELFLQPAICLVEWYDLGRGVIPKPNLTIDFSYLDDQNISKIAEVDTRKLYYVV